MHAARSLQTHRGPFRRRTHAAVASCVAAVVGLTALAGSLIVEPVVASSSSVVLPILFQIGHQGVSARVDTEKNGVISSEAVTRPWIPGPGVTTQLRVTEGTTMLIFSNSVGASTSGFLDLPEPLIDRHRRMFLRLLVFVEPTAGPPLLTADVLDKHGRLELTASPPCNPFAPVPVFDGFAVYSCEHTSNVEMGKKASSVRVSISSTQRFAVIAGGPSAISGSQLSD